MKKFILSIACLVHLSSKNGVVLNGGFEVQAGSMLEISNGSCFPINGN